MPRSRTSSLRGVGLRKAPKLGSRVRLVRIGTVISKVDRTTKLPKVLQLSSVRRLKSDTGFLQEGSLVEVSVDIQAMQKRVAEGKIPDQGYPLANHALRSADSVIVRVDKGWHNRELTGNPAFFGTVVYKFNKNNWQYEKADNGAAVYFNSGEKGYPPIRTIQRVELEVED